MKSTSKGHVVSNRPAEGGLGRREFLVLTSSCAAATVAFGPNLFADVFAQPRDLAVGVMPIDHIDGARLAPASRLNAADRAFLRNGANVNLSGVGTTGGAQRTIAFRPHFRVGDDDIAVDAWGFNHASGSYGGPVSFVMPADVQQSLRFSLVIDGDAAQRRAAGEAKTETKNRTPSLTLSLRNEPDSVKLTRAYYVIVPLHDGASAPRWSDFTLVEHRGHMVMHEMRNGVMQPVDREHFVLRVDYAGATA